MLIWKHLENRDEKRLLMVIYKQYLFLNALEQ